MFIIILIAVIVGIIWGIYLSLRGSLVAGGMVVLLSTCCLGMNFLSFEVAGITLTLDRLFLLGLMVAYFVQWRFRRIDPKPLTRVDLFLTALVGVLLFSTFSHDLSSDPRHANVIQHLINGYLIPLALYWIARQAVLNERNVTLILSTLTCFGAYLALTGILETAGQWSLVFPRYISNPDIGLHFGRARGPMVHSVSYGFYLATCLMAAWLWRQRIPRLAQVVVVLLVPAMLAAIFFTKTRTVWLGTATGIMLILALTLRGRIRIVVLGSLVFAGLLVGVTKMDSLVSLEREGNSQDARHSSSMRASFAYVSWEMFQDRPLLGFGFGQFVTAKLPYLSDRSVNLKLEDIRPYVHHNTFLSLLTETGLIGLGLYLAVLVGWAYYALKLVLIQRAPPWVRRHGLLLLSVLGIASWQMMGHEITFSPLDHSLLFMLAGITVGLQPWVLGNQQSLSPSAALSRLETVYDGRLRPTS